MGKVKIAQSPSKNNDGTLHTRNLILCAMSLIYLCAFLTFYYQSPGLFGRNGIMPAQYLYSAFNGNSNIIKTPTLVHYYSYLGLDVHYMLDFIALLGAFISFITFISRKLCIIPIFATLWTLYYSLVKVTQIFEHQFDNLLLEAGFACLILAPLSDTKESGPADKIGLVLLKWILFRFMFDSGAVKFFSGCPLWWSFRGLQHHFETMPLPTPMAWWSHHLPNDFMMITNIYTNLTELVCPWFFFFPSRAVRIFLFYWIFYLQLSIVLTGNYGFLNFLVTTLLLTLLDDKYLTTKSKKRLFLEIVSSVIVFTFAIYLATGLIQHKKFTFKYEHLGILRSMTKISPLVAVVAVISTFITNIISHPTITSSNSFLKKATSVNMLLAFTLSALTLIGISVVPHNNIDTSLNITNTQLGKYYQDLNKYHIVNEYGRHLRRMRTERLEVNLEYSTQIDGPWKTIPFLFKPWNENQSLTYSGPYLSRLDMKFYDAAPKSYRDHLWIMPLAYRILQNEPDVLRLFGLRSTLKPTPKYVRGTLFRFAYSPFNAKSKFYWKKTIVGEHFPPVALSDTILTTHLRNLSYPPTARIPRVTNHFLKNILDFIRKKLQLFEASKAIAVICITARVINVVRV